MDKSSLFELVFRDLIPEIEAMGVEGQLCVLLDRRGLSVEEVESIAEIAQRNRLGLLYRARKAYAMLNAEEKLRHMREFFGLLAEVSRDSKRDFHEDQVSFVLQLSEELEESSDLDSILYYQNLLLSVTDEWLVKYLDRSGVILFRKIWEIFEGEKKGPIESANIEKLMKCLGRLNFDPKLTEEWEKLIEKIERLRASITEGTDPFVIFPSNRQSIEFDKGSLTFMESIGNSNKSILYKAHWEERNMDVAVKIYKCQSDSQPGTSQYRKIETVTKEIEILEFCSTKMPRNFVEYYGMYRVPQNNYTEIGIVMEYCTGGTLYDKLVRRRNESSVFSNLELWTIAKQLIEALTFLEDSKKYHNDIKLGNIFIVGDSLHCKIGDFDASENLDGVISSAAILKTAQVPIKGTREYFPPEIQEISNTENKASALKNVRRNKIDVYMLGMSLLYLYYINVELVDYNKPEKFHQLQMKIEEIEID